MRVVVAIDERVGVAALSRLPGLLDLRDAQMTVVHVLDPGGRAEWQRVAGHHLLRPHSPQTGARSMYTADHDEGERLLAAAATTLSQTSVAQVRTRLLEGSPKHTIQALLADEPADALVVFVHGREVGPKSIGKEARFLIDHAPCAVLVVKG
jgi:nucleotide-binding universal stress UspA family protein